MKVWVNKMVGPYAGGLAIVAADSEDEASKVLAEYRHTEHLFNWYDNENMQSCFDSSKVDSPYFPRDNWQRLPNVTAFTCIPSVLEVGYYYE